MVLRLWSVPSKLKVPERSSMDRAIAVRQKAKSTVNGLREPIPHQSGQQNWRAVRDADQHDQLRDQNGLHQAISSSFVSVTETRMLKSA